MASAVDDLITDAQIADYAKLIHKVSGICVSTKKKMLLSNRVRRRLRATGIDSFQSYYQQLCKLSVGDPEWDAFLQEITTHETYLFRDACHWDWFRNTYLPELDSLAKKSSRKKHLRIWSAACSTGDEAYTVACCIADCLKNCEEWKIEILGTDIGVDTVKTAQQATFCKRAMKRVPKSYCRRFFDKHREDDLWTAKPQLSRWIQFRQHNLLHPLDEQPFDLVFLKNVLIYFDTSSKQKAIDHVLDAMRPGGVLVTSAAENVSDQLRDIERLSPWMHRKAVSSNQPGATIESKR